MRKSIPAAIALALGLAASTVCAAPGYVNALLLDAGALDASGGVEVNTRRLGYFSDMYYDAKRREWWALSDRGPGGGNLHYETRLQRFTVEVDPVSGAISDFQVLETIVFGKGNQPLDGISPEPFGPLGAAFDPEGLVVNPINGHFLISDEYGPSLLEINGAGKVVHRYETPANLLPRNGQTGVINHANGEAGNNAGKRLNRGFEGLAISPDGRTVFAMLQSAMLDEGGGSGIINRIVAFDTKSRRAQAQYAYTMEGSSQGRGISALVALNDHEFLVLERNNRGLGVDGELTPPNKKIFRIDLTGATDVSDISLSTGSFTTVAKSGPWLDLAAPATLASASYASLNHVSLEKWEGLAIGPQLADGSYLMLAGTDNDYSVTQDANTAEQMDVYFAPSGATVTRVRCIIGTKTGCSFINANGSVGAAVPAGTDLDAYTRIPAVLQAYKVPAADLPVLVRPR
jgi:hypothetical protein